MTIFNPVTQVAINTPTLSNSVTFTAPTTLTITNSVGTFVVNGTDTLSTSVTVQAGDNIQVKVTSSSSNLTPIVSVITDGVSIFEFIVITEDTPSSVYDPKDSKVLPLFDPDSLLSQQSTIPSNTGNIVSVIDTTSDTVVSTVDINNIGYPAGYNPTAPRDYVFAVNFYSNSLVRIDLANNLAVDEITVGNGPYALATGADANGRSIPYVTNYFDDTVSRISVDTYTEDAVIPVGVAPTSIVSDINNNIWVANSGESSLTKITVDPNTGSYTTQTISIGTRPTDITASEQFIWVSSITDNIVVRVDILSNSYTVIPVGNNPVGITTDVLNYVYVANSYDGTVSVIDVSTGAILNTFSVGPYPTFLTADINNFWVTDLHENNVRKYVSGSSTLVSTVTVQPRPFGISEGLPGTVWVSSMYATLPDRFVQKDSIAEDINFPPILNVDRNTVYSTPEIVVTSINYPLPVTVSPISDSSAILVINGVPAVSGDTLNYGDTIRIQVTSSNLYEKETVAEYIIGSSVLRLSVTTLIPDRLPDFFEFIPQTVNPFTQVTSNTITISGLSPQYSIPITIDSGTLIINGVTVPGLSSTVSNGDTVAVSTSSGGYCSTNIVYVDTPIFKTFFSVSVADDPAIQPPTTYLPFGLAFNDTVNALPSNTVESDVLTVNLPANQTSTVAVGSQYNAFIKVNGVNVGQIASIQNNDTISISCTSIDAESARFQIPFMTCGVTLVWNITTIPDVTPNPFTFIPRIGLKANEKSQSNDITISGITSGTLIPASVSPPCNVYVNGVLQTVDINNNPLPDLIPENARDVNQSFTFNVELGDTVSLEGLSWSYAETASYVLTIGNASGSYDLTAINLISPPDKRTSNNLAGRKIHILTSSYQLTSGKDVLIGDISSNIPFVKDSSVKLSDLSTSYTVRSSHVETSNPLSSDVPIYVKATGDLPSGVSPNYSNNVGNLPIADIHSISRQTSTLISPTLFRSSVYLIQIFSPIKDGKNKYVIDTNPADILALHPVEVPLASIKVAKADSIYTKNSPNWSTFYKKTRTVNAQYYRFSHSADRRIGTFHYKFPFYEFRVSNSAYNRNTIHEFRLVGSDYGRYYKTERRSPYFIFDKYTHNQRRFDFPFSRYYGNFRQVQANYNRNTIHEIHTVSVENNRYYSKFRTIGTTYVTEKVNKRLLNQNTYSRHVVKRMEYNAQAIVYSKKTLESSLPSANIYYVTRASTNSLSFSKQSVTYKSVSTLYDFVSSSSSKGIPLPTIAVFNDVWEESDNTQFGNSMLGYFNDISSIEAYVLNTRNLQPLEIQTYEIRPGGYIWAEIKPLLSKCEADGLNAIIAGWLKGG